MAHRAYRIQQETPATSNIFAQNYAVTGIRSYAADNTPLFSSPEAVHHDPAQAEYKQCSIRAH